ncbi:hypothetical protein MW887_010523 [Aspergillus wentii]|nr:hypothetical protein MW887_010523 [Aspergillus wentii]
MNAAAALRARMATSFVARRGFSTTRAQLGSPYHYAEGPRSNIPFNPHTRFFAVRYWSFMSRCRFRCSLRHCCLANQQDPLNPHALYFFRHGTLGTGKIVDKCILNSQHSDIVYKAREFD